MQRTLVELAVDFALGSNLRILRGRLNLSVAMDWLLLESKRSNDQFVLSRKEPRTQALEFFAFVVQDVLNCGSEFIELATLVSSAAPGHEWFNVREWLHLFDETRLNAPIRVWRKGKAVFRASITLSEALVQKSMFHSQTLFSPTMVAFIGERVQVKPQFTPEEANYHRQWGKGIAGNEADQETFINAVIKAQVPNIQQEFWKSNPAMIEV